jgi:site-specific DNA-methyltransferase (adenine-specific)
VSLPTPYYEDDAVTIYHGDCAEILPTLTDVDLVFTSPPYNLGVTSGGGMHAGSLAAADLAGGYGTHDDAMAPEDYDRWQREIVHLLWSTLSDSGAIFYNHKPRPWAGEVILPTKYGDGLPLRQIIVWDRGTGMNFSESHFLPKCEWVIVWAKPKFRLRSRSASQVGDVWRIPPETNARHPAPFPLALPATAIEAAAPAVVLDPFSGSGTTLRAAKDAGCRAIGIELDERYCEIAARRMGQEVLDL